MPIVFCAQSDAADQRAMALMRALRCAEAAVIRCYAATDELSRIEAADDKPTMGRRMNH